MPVLPGETDPITVLSWCLTQSHDSWPHVMIAVEKREFELKYHIAQNIGGFGVVLF